MTIFSGFGRANGPAVNTSRFYPKIKTAIKARVTPLDDFMEDQWGVRFH